MLFLEFWLRMFLTVFHGMSFSHTELLLYSRCKHKSLPFIFKLHHIKGKVKTQKTIFSLFPTYKNNNFLSNIASYFLFHILLEHMFKKFYYDLILLLWEKNKNTLRCLLLLQQSHYWKFLLFINLTNVNSLIKIN